MNHLKLRPERLIFASTAHSAGTHAHQRAPHARGSSDEHLPYLEAGEGLPVLLVHGWPTSSFLWRGVIPYIAEHRRVLAIDLPGFGESSKPVDRDYSFAFFRSVLDGFAAAVGLESFGLAVHDMGGPVALNWASSRPESVERLAILNTIVYPEFSLAVRAFLAAARVPGVGRVLSSRAGLAGAMRFGTVRSDCMTDEALEGTCAPFAHREAREALIRSVQHLGADGLRPVAAWMRGISVPVRVVYGTRDWILPAMPYTVRRLQEEVADIEVTALDDCSHFLQEDRPDRVGELLAAFFR